MEVKNENISEVDYVGRFLLKLYHKRRFGNNGKIEKCIIQNEFQNYFNENPFPTIENVKLGTLLRRNKFLFNANSTIKTSIFIIHMNTFSQYFKQLLKRLDEEQKRVISERITIVYPFVEFKEAEKPTVDPNFKKEQLTFKANYKVFEDKNFISTSKGCCICQKHFDLEIDYIDHIEYHTQDSNFESLRFRSQTQIQFVLISYQMCKDSPLLRFCIESIHSDLKIQKVVIVRDSSMVYPQELDTPYSLVAGEQTYFYIDCHTFEIGFEQPVVIVFKDIFAAEVSEMRVEQHHFLRIEPFIVNIGNAINQFIPKRGELTFATGLKDYFPPRDLRENEMSTILNNCPRFQEYEGIKKVINQANFEDIYRLLLQLEDTAILNLYKSLTQKETTVTTSGEYFLVKLKLHNDVNVEDILKEGDKVELFATGNKNVISPPHRNKSHGTKKLYGFIEAVFKDRIVFSLKNSKTLNSEKQYDVRFCPLRYHLILQYRALELLESLRDVKKFLFPSQRAQTGKEIRISISPYNGKLGKNPEQLEAVERIVNHIIPEVPYIIFGPPGTGKTTTIVEAIYQLRKDNPTNRILVVGGSNACVDEIAARLFDLFNVIDPSGKNMLRLYSSAQGKKSERVDENLIKISNLCHGYQFYPSLDIVYMYPIVFATLSIAAKYVHGGLAADHFSHVFIDECGASTEPEVIAALIGTVTCRTKVILAGDPKQLGPVLQSKTAEELGLGVSLLERLMNLECYKTEPGSKTYDRSIQMRLTKNFRTHPSILNMSNELYYENDLEACGLTKVTNWASNWYKLPSPNFPVIFHSVKGKSERRNGSRSLYNWAEMVVVMNYIKEMMYFGINERQMEQCDIGIVTPYKSQVNLIRRELDARKWFEIEVGSIEKFQGQERPVILLSTVRSQTESLGFLVNAKRLNVALTRAQALLIIVGNPETLSASPDFNYVINYCKENGALKGEKYSLSRQSSCSNLSGVSINECFKNDDNNRISLTASLETLDTTENFKHAVTIKGKLQGHELKHRSRNKGHLPTAKVQPSKNIRNHSFMETIVRNKKVDDWLVDMRDQKNTSVNPCHTMNLRQIQNSNSSSLSDSRNEVISHVETDIHSVQPMNVVYPSIVEHSAMNSAVSAPTYRQLSANHSTMAIPSYNSIYAHSSGQTTNVTGVGSRPAQPMQREITTPTYPILHRDIRNTEFWKNEEANLNSRTVYTPHYNSSKVGHAVKKDKPACVIL